MSNLELSNFIKKLPTLRKMIKTPQNFVRSSLCKIKKKYGKDGGEMFAPFPLKNSSECLHNTLYGVTRGLKGLKKIALEEILFN